MKSKIDELTEKSRATDEDIAELARLLKRGMAARHEKK